MFDSSSAIISPAKIMKIIDTNAGPYPIIWTIIEKIQTDNKNHSCRSSTVQMLKETESLQIELKSTNHLSKGKMAEELRLLRTWSSPYALRVVQALKIKGLVYETVLEDLTTKSASLLEYNPLHKKVPVLLHNGRPVCESLVILEYIDDMWKQPPLIPQDPYEKAMARFWAKFGDDKVMPSTWSVFISQGKEQQEAIGPFTDNLKLLEGQLKGKRFFGGQAIGYLDLAFGWLSNLISILEEIIDLKLVDAEKFPLLSVWMNNFSDDPVIKDCWPPRDKMVEKFKAMREPYLKQTE